MALMERMFSVRLQKMPRSCGGRVKDMERRILSPRGIWEDRTHLGDAMDEQQPQQPTIRITLDDNIAQGEYINFANIIHSPSEFVIDLGRVVPGRTEVKVYSRVITTPLHAKQLLEALAHNIGLYESKFGEI